MRQRGLEIASSRSPAAAERQGRSPIHRRWTGGIGGLTPHTSVAPGAFKRSGAPVPIPSASHAPPSQSMAPVKERGLHRARAQVAMRPPSRQTAPHAAVDRRGARRAHRAGPAVRDGGGRDPRGSRRARGSTRRRRCGRCSSGSRAHGDARLPRLRGRARSPSTSTSAPRPTLAHRLRRRLRRAEGRPGRHRHAQLPRVVDRVLGRGRGRRGRRAAQRVVDRARAGVRPERLGRRRCCSSTPSALERLARRTPASLGLARVDRRQGRAAHARRRRRAVRGRARRRSTADGRAARRRASIPRTTPRSSTPRARPAGRRARSAPTATSARNLIEPRLRAGARARRAAGRARRRRAGAGGPERVPAVRAVLPRHRLPLGPRGQPRLRREDRDHAQVGRRAGARADRARAGHHLRRRAGDGVAGARVTPTSTRATSRACSRSATAARRPPPELVRRIEALFPGRTPSNGYGLTETSSVTTMNVGRRLPAQARQRRRARAGRAR